MFELNPETIALGGTTLVEASAGTGKTYTIVSLYVRLLLEKELLPEQILVVTYTKAATQELRSRIRERVREALGVMSGGECSDPFLVALCAGALRDGVADRYMRLLERALATFDTAAIFTIHGFALRVLKEHAFESGMLQDTELMTSQNALVREVVEDFWRINFFHDEAPLVALMLLHRESPESLVAFLAGLRPGPGVAVVPSFSEAEVAALDVACREEYVALVGLWEQQADAVMELLATDKGLKRSQDAYKLPLLDGLRVAMDGYAGGGNPYDAFPDFIKFTSTELKRQCKARQSPPEHPFFEVCTSLHGLLEQRYLALKWELVAFFMREMPLRKRQRNVRFFDDLLEDLYGALQAGCLAGADAALSVSGTAGASASGGAGGSLALKLAGRYRVALIDEFQDTDRVQYEIFRAIYGESGAPLFLIGDPKQSIYSFRGADIFAYMRAAREVSPDRCFTLMRNWRSVPLLLESFNQLFSLSSRPFVFEGIGYHRLLSGRGEAVQGEAVGSGDGVPEPGVAEGSKDGGECEGDGGVRSPMQLWFLDPGDEKNGQLSVEVATYRATVVVVDEIIRLLDAAHEGVSASDIAVIVRSHRQGGMMLDMLQQRGVAAVMGSDRSVFASHEAAEVRLLLAALLNPRDGGKVLAALSTDLFGRTARDLERLQDDDEAWSREVASFESYRELWGRRGFMVMSRRLLESEGMFGRLLSFADGSGDRRVTNLLHCFELLHRYEHDGRAGMQRLFAWFSERMELADADEEFQTRLETDAAVVRIVTVHVSKGLEYPVVFVPYQWSGANRGDGVLSFHDGDGELVRDFGSEAMGTHRALAAREELAEQLRLLYVAVTRARDRCYLLTTKIRAGASAINYLLHWRDGEEVPGDGDMLVARLGEHVAGLPLSGLVGAMRKFADASGGAVEYRNLDAGVAEVCRMKKPVAGVEYEPCRRSFGRVVDNGWGVASFSSLSRQEGVAGQAHVEQSERDEVAVVAERGDGVVMTGNDVEEVEGIFAFPKGADAGIFMHALFEELDFAVNDPGVLEALVSAQLERFGYGQSWIPVIAGMVGEVLATSLASPTGPFTLGSLRRGAWQTELEFFVPLGGLRVGELRELLVRFGSVPGGCDLAAMAQRITFRDVSGMLMGFIDMVFEHDGRFYLLDWKSNHLGNTIASYGAASIRQAMEEHLYPLQYLLYCVAFDAYLRNRVAGYRYEEQFGGVIYVFLRGVSAACGESYGFFRDVPPVALIDGLRDLLCGDKG